MTDRIWLRAGAWLKAQAQKPYRTIAVLFAGAFLLRLALQPVLGHMHAYATFLPVVMIVSYRFGPRRGAVAAGLSVAFGFLFFSGAFGGFASLRAAGAGVILFGLNCAVVIYLVAALTATLRELSAAQGRSEAMANTHAQLFREVNERITHHLRLVAGVLALQASGEPEPKVSAGLRKAAERSLQISRAHADLAGRSTDAAPFRAVCERIVQALLASEDLPVDRVRVEADGDFSLDPESATALSAALLECLSAVLKLKPAGPLVVRLSRDARQCSAQVLFAEGVSSERIRALADGFLLQAVVDQLGAKLRQRSGAGQSMLEVRFETDGPAPEAFLQQTLH